MVSLNLTEPDQQQREQLEKTRGNLEALLRQEPNNPRWLYMRACVDFQLGHVQEAEGWMERALIRLPNSIDITYAYGLMLMAQKKFMAAWLMMQRAVALKPDHADAYYCIGASARKIGDLLGAVSAFSKSLELNPRDPAAWNERGTSLKDLGRLDDAIASYREALNIDPHYALAANNLGVVHFLKVDLDGAGAWYERALAEKPDYPEALSNLSVILRVKGKIEESIACCRKALELRPEYPEALNNLGNTYKDAMRLEEAIEAYEATLRLCPDDGDFHNNLSIAQLLAGRFEEGWREQEWRWKARQFKGSGNTRKVPLWAGEPGEGRTLLVHAEQGFGDTLQFCRYAPMIRERGFRVVMEVQVPLKRLMQSLDGVDTVIAHGEEVPEHAFHCPMMTLPMVFQTNLENIPGHIPYLSCDAQDIARWRERVQKEAGDALKVGVVWAGQSRSQSPDLVITDRARSITPEVLAPLMDVPGVRFFSLQKIGAAAPESFHLIDWMDECRDFTDTGALVMNLDLVICVDTAVAHLAGALGKPVWLLNRFNNCWRWLRGREDSPWYPGTLRLFTQKELGAWAGVIERVRAALVERAQAR